MMDLSVLIQPTHLPFHFLQEGVKGPTWSQQSCDKVEEEVKQIVGIKNDWMRMKILGIGREYGESFAYTEKLKMKTNL